ncbi:MP domain-containing protein [Melia azedarach]|uniref:MP domain-containing protein n=1 Tax=Melia azedarach TaxID=155640 RepID=A0ACC1XEQ6_MELAZ|nr:MP domain-containing protein [Melia azedarach]
MADHFQNWELPKISKKEIYHTSIFNFKKDDSIKTTEGTVLLNNKQKSIQLLQSSTIQHLRFDSTFRYLHLGLVQVGIKPLTREVRDTAVLLCLRDNRFLDFNASLLSVLESSLAEGPVHFNYFPNFMVSLEDQNILSVLTLNIKFQNLEMEDTSFPFLLMCRICYKCMRNSGNPAAKKSSPIDRTTFYQTHIRTPNKIVSRNIKWCDVQFPEEWKIREVTPRETRQYGFTRRLGLHVQSVEIDNRYPPEDGGESSEHHCHNP